MYGKEVNGKPIKVMNFTTNEELEARKVVFKKNPMMMGKFQYNS